MGVGLLEQESQFLTASGSGCSPLSSSASSLPSSLTVFCDFDGPIMDVSDRYYQTYRRAIAHVQRVSANGSIRPLSKAQFWELKQNRAPDLEIALRSGMARSHLKIFTDYIRTIVNHPDLLAYDQLQVGVRWALMLLRAQGARVVLVTLRQADQVLAILQQENLLDLFSDVWGSEDAMAAYHNQAKHKEVLLRQAMEAARKTCEVPFKACMIGDTEADILAGQALGIETIALTCGVRSQGYLEDYHPSCIQTSLLAAVQKIVSEQALRVA
jgi:phosphoglycolate phosphatase